MLIQDVVPPPEVLGTWQSVDKTPFRPEKGNQKQPRGKPITVTFV